MAFINFADPGAIRDSRREADPTDRHTRGFFLDLKTLAAALTSKSHSLDSLAKFLEVPGKIEFDRLRATDRRGVRSLCPRRHRGDLAMLPRTDAPMFRQHVLTQTLPHRIYSEASLGKAYLREMGIEPWRRVQPDFDPEIIGAIMSSYFGGRAEIHRRREIVQTLYCDFASMYPTVCTLMGSGGSSLHREWRTKTRPQKRKRFWISVTVADLKHTETWREFRVLVQVHPDADIFPVRARYRSEPIATIGLNYLSAGQAALVHARGLCGLKASDR